MPKNKVWFEEKYADYYSNKIFVAGGGGGWVFSKSYRLP